MPFHADLLTGDHDRLARLFAGEPDVDDPLHGRVRGREAFARYADELRRWLGERDAVVEPVATIASGARSVEEVVHCTATDDGTACAIEYNAVRWGTAELPPQAGVAVYVRGASGRLAAARIYDDVEPPAASDSTRDA